MSLQYVTSGVPAAGWLCKVFKYNMINEKESGKASLTANIRCAYTPDRSQASVNFGSIEDSGWHGKCLCTDRCIDLSFNCRDAEYTPHFSYLYKTSDGCYQGHDYAGREVSMTLLDEWEWNGDEWQILDAV